jgi:hypothetical protein
MRVIFVPQYPSTMRYQEWWYTEFPIQFRNAGLDVYVVGKDYIDNNVLTKSEDDMFSPIKQAIEFETYQINDYMNLELYEDDILFWTDVSFPGLFGHVLFHKKPNKIFCFCHATSLNHYDYFDPVRQHKAPIEQGLSGLFKSVFVGSRYHKAKLGWYNTQVISMPYPPMTNDFFKNNTKYTDIISVARPSIQKVDTVLETLVETRFKLTINRPVSNTWRDYFYNLSTSKILLITANEDTFGYQIVDAILNDCIPIARNDFAYPELLPREYLYDNDEELMEKIEYYLSGDNYKEVPTLICEDAMNNFYQTLIEEMTKTVE